MGPLYTLRRRLGLTQEEFAAQLGRSQVMVSLYERRARPVPSDLVLKIWDRWRPELTALGYSLDDLLRGSRAA